MASWKNIVARTLFVTNSPSQIDLSGDISQCARL
jgi:hypothetical protein